jgi:hypothetical protein
VFSIKGADQLLRIQHFKTLNRLNVAGSDLAFLVYDERQFLGLVVLTVQFEFHFLEIQDDVGHVLNHAGQRGELVLRAGDFYRGNGRAFERGKQDAPEGVPNGVTVAGLKRLGGELCIGICGRALVFSESLRHFKRP